MKQRGTQPIANGYNTDHAKENSCRNCYSSESEEKIWKLLHWRTSSGNKTCCWEEKC